MTDYWLCQDCLFVAVNGDYSGLDYSYSPEQAIDRALEIDNGLDNLGPIAPNGEELEFSRLPCDCCGTRLAGSRYGFLETRA